MNWRMLNNNKKTTAMCSYLKYYVDHLRCFSIFVVVADGVDFTDNSLAILCLLDLTTATGSFICFSLTVVFLL